jgi:pimeloyl-ACP methyl ester carboxylesterase
VKPGVPVAIDEGEVRVGSGYAPVNGLRMYYEEYGDPGPGRPLVLLHGGLLTIELSFGMCCPAWRRAGG